MNSHLPSSPDPAHSPSMDAEPLDYDPVYLQSRRELGVIVVLFLTFFVWSVGVCYWLGYDPPSSAEGPTAMTWGMPTWVFWGILVPWLAVDVVAVWFCFFVMKDDDLGETHEGEDVVRQVQREALRKLEEQHHAGEEGPRK